MRIKPPLGSLLILAMLTVAFTLSAHRPDADDEYYINTAIRLMQRWDIRLQDFSFMDSAYTLLSYNSTTAAVSFVSGTPFLVNYYLVFPAIAAFVFVFVAYRLFGSLIGGYAFLATLVFVAVTILWGDEHRSPGNFAYVRLFQGKSIFVFLIVPILLLYSIEFYRDRSPSKICLLMLAASAGIGATQSAVLLVPLFFLMAAAFISPNLLNIALLRPRAGAAELRRDLMLLGGIALVLGVAVWLLWNVGQTAQWRAGMLVPKTIGYTLGSGPRTYLAFFCLFLLPFLVNGRLRFPMTFLVVVAATVTLSPMLSLLVGALSKSASWRLVWIVPFVMAVTLAIVRVSQAGIFGEWRWARCAAAALALIAFAYAGRPTFSPDNYTSFGWPTLKTVNPNEIVLKRFGKPVPIINYRVCPAPTKCF